MMRVIRRMGLLGLPVVVATSCAHASRADVAFGPTQENAPVCTVRVESGYSVPIEAGVRAGNTQVPLGMLEPEETVEIGVPCSYQTVTVFRLVRNGGSEADVPLRPRSRALDHHGVTTVTLTPRSSRD